MVLLKNGVDNTTLFKKRGDKMKDFNRFTKEFLSIYQTYQKMLKDLYKPTYVPYKFPIEHYFFPTPIQPYPINLQQHLRDFLFKEI